MNRYLIRASIVVAALFASKPAFSTLLTLDFTLDQFSTHDYVYTHDNTGESDDYVSGNIGPVKGSVTYGLDFQTARDSGLQPSSFDNGFYASYSMIMPFSLPHPTGPFYSGMIGTVDLSAYSEKETFANMYLSTGFNYGDMQGSEGIHLAYQVWWREEYIEGDFRTEEVVSYNSHYFLLVTAREEFDDFTLTSLDAVEQAIFNHELSGEFYFSETLTTDKTLWDADTSDYISTTGRSVSYYGEATSSSVTKVTAPGTMSIMFLGLGALAMYRRRNGKDVNI